MLLLHYDRSTHPATVGIVSHARNLCKRPFLFVLLALEDFRETDGGLDCDSPVVEEV